MSRPGVGHIREDDLELFVCGQIRESLAIDVRSHLSECEICNGRLKKTVEYLDQSADSGGTQPTERRCEPRIPARESASMQLMSPLMMGRSEVLVLNVSENGLMLRTAEFTQVGIILRIRFKARFVLGEVCYCVPMQGVFLVGVKIQSQWYQGEDRSWEM